MKREILEAKRACDEIIGEISRIFVGRREILEKILACALSNGHVLIEDYPGLGKTLLAKSLSKLLGLKFTRIQFTPDLLPADIIGTKIWRQREGEFELVKGPIFTNVLLADEINRTPPKTQAALLEAMEERQVTIEGETHRLSPPFFVIATQNPIEQEGTYPLPEAQMDRFLMRISLGYPESIEDEMRVLERRIGWKRDDPTLDLEPIISGEDFLRLQRLCEEIYVDGRILRYIGEMIRRTREDKRVEVGVSPRGGIALLKASRAVALMDGREFVIPDDVKKMAEDTLSHRLILTVEEALEGRKEREIIRELIEETPVPKE